MTRFGELYDKLVVMPRQATFPAYYKLVQRVIEEMKEDFPEGTHADWQMGRFGEFYEKWFGIGEEQ